MGLGQGSSFVLLLLTWVVVSNQRDVVRGFSGNCSDDEFFVCCQLINASKGYQRHIVRGLLCSE